MATFEEIRNANKTIATTTISREDKKTGKIISKEYAEVNQRVKAFRMVYPNGAIVPEIVFESDGVVTFKVTVYDDSGKIIGVGHAQEREASSYINKTSYIENCETSAVGRALGMCGFGIDTSIASAEEMLNALKNQSKKSPDDDPFVDSSTKREDEFTPANARYEKAIGQAQRIIDAIKTPEDVNKAVSLLPALDHERTSKKESSMLLHEKATSFGLVWNKTSGTYIPKEDKQ